MDVVWHLQKWEEARPVLLEHAWSFRMCCHDLLGNLERVKYGKTRWQAPEWLGSGEELTVVVGGIPGSK